MEYVAALDIKEDLRSEADALQSIARMVKLRSPKLKLPNGNEEGIREPDFKSPKQIEYYACPETSVLTMLFFLLEINAMETADLMNAMDQESPGDLTYGDSDNESVAPTQPATEEHQQPLPLHQGVSIARDDINHDVSASSAPTGPIPATSGSVRQVDVINVPMAEVDRVPLQSCTSNSAGRTISTVPGHTYTT
ncbi:hypothetical protein F442_10355 [Phytophthora nicotianae P10297]|uniref:Uncharacterized protein n=1 Tax=Phytophthora nicotianae P10297 TaxID=1317064 RepID=W2Z740_PHYNI|nr:hypothetical protein F442_10355 [Phytophthora nicotianae P10297]